MTTKVQKKSKDASISVLTMLEQENFRTAFVEVLTDTIIFFRIEDVMFRLQNVFSPCLKQRLDWEAESNYSGYGIIYTVLNIRDENDLCSLLSNATHDMMYKNEDNAEELAVKIFTLWHHQIKIYFSTKNH